MAAPETLASPPSLQVAREDPGALVVRLAGSWTLHDALPDPDEITGALAAGGVRQVAFDASGVAKWDSGLLTFLRKVVEAAASSGASVDRDSLPDGMRRLLDLATAVPERAGARRTEASESFLTRVGNATNQARVGGREMVRFVGETSIALGRFARGKARYRRSDLMLVIQECGADALPIVTLISFLVGLILAFVGAVQLQQFGAQIFVADLVAIGMARSMGAMMTGIIMAGRTGAAFAAQLGTMTVNEEIDALSTMGIPPMEFLVLPRMLALMLMMPLLCLYSDVMGMLGGAVVGVGMLDLGVREYYQQTASALDLVDIGVGVVNATVYGVLVAFAGCLRGIQCGRSAQAVGAATTSAVVLAIVLIVVSTAILTVIFQVLGI